MQAWLRLGRWVFTGTGIYRFYWHSAEGRVSRKEASYLDGCGWKQSIRRWQQLDPVLEWRKPKSS